MFDPLSEEQHWIKSVYSMILVISINVFLYKIKAGKNGVGNKQESGRERKRETDKGSKRQSIGENRKWLGLRKGTFGKRYLSI